MVTKTKGDKLEVYLEGPISEKTALFKLPLKSIKEIHLNLSKVTFINSIGVKNWIDWISRIPTAVKLTIDESPYVIIHQVNSVYGFLPRYAKINSFIAPYSCEECAFEKNYKLTVGAEYHYSNENSPSQLNLPKDQKCPKCGSELAPDFLVEKVFKFLKN